MPAFFIRQRRLLIVFLARIAWLAMFSLWRDETFGLPLDEPIALMPAGTIDQPVRIRLEAPHQIRLDVSFGLRPRSEAMQLIGSRWKGRDRTLDGPLDVGVPLRWSLADESGRVVWSGDSETHGIDAHGSADASRDVAFIGAYANVLLIVPVIGSFAMILIGFALRDWVRSRRV